MGFPNKSSQFKKGQSGNPHGKPSGSPNIKTLIIRVWNQEITDSDGNKTIYGLLVIKAMFDKAKEGNVHAFRAICERLEGLPQSDVEQNVIQYNVLPSIRMDDGTELKFNVGD